MKDPPHNFEVCPYLGAIQYVVEVIGGSDFILQGLWKEQAEFAVFLSLSEEIPPRTRQIISVQVVITYMSAVCFMLEGR